ncbi:hypothetical protein GCM10020331_086440 [Ectobacillus funiculus]
MPLLPTTTIGSFPQTQEVRKQRLKWRKGELTNAEYETYIKAEIKKMDRHSRRAWSRCVCTWRV